MEFSEKTTVSMPPIYPLFTRCEPKIRGKGKSPVIRRLRGAVEVSEGHIQREVHAGIRVKNATAAFDKLAKD
jgi:hypothetical protein